MAKVVKIKLNHAGVRSLLKSAEIQDYVGEKAAKIAVRCGAGYESRTGMTSTRAIATVRAATADARRDNRKNNTLEKALK